MPPAAPPWPIPSCPPCVFSGQSPEKRRSCSSTNRAPSPFAQNPESSIVTSTVIV